MEKILTQQDSEKQEKIIDPLVSIVILTKNGGELFKESIRMIFSQETTFSYEVVTVDSGSTDGTLEFLRNCPVRIYQIAPKDFCFGPTRDFGFCQAKGDYIVTISQDVVPKGEYWLQNLIIPLLENKADVVQGYVKVPEDRKVFFWERKGMFYLTSLGEDFCRYYGNIGLSCTNLAVKRSVWGKIKFGDVPINEDKMFQKKAYSKGYKFARKKNAIAYHGHNYDLPSLIKRCENEGMGWRYAGVKYKFIQMLRDLKQKRWVYRELIRGILRRDITNLAELLFLFIRPIFLYKGNLFNTEYKF